MPTKPHAIEEPLVFVTACDDNYACGVAAGIRSAIDSVPSNRTIRVFVLDGGITESSKAKLHRSWQADHVELQWLAPNLESIQDLPVSDHVSLTTYLRILLAEMVPADVQRAIYLDADTIVVNNLEHLWSVPLDGLYCAATQDAFVPFLDPAVALSHPVHAMTLRNTDPRPIPNYEELGLDPRAPYFNAGVMLVNVDRWRRDQVARRAFECLRDNAGHVRWWDQYALNTLFSGQWKILDPRWNQNSHVFRIEDWRLSHYTEEELTRLRSFPWIVHFDAKPKPWDSDCVHPFRRYFFRHLDRTAWRGWRPRQSTGQRWHRLYSAYRTWRRQRIAPFIRNWKKQWLSRAA